MGRGVGPVEIVTDVLRSVDTLFDLYLALAVLFEPTECCHLIGHEEWFLNRFDALIGQRKLRAFRAFLLASLLK